MKIFDSHKLKKIYRNIFLAQDRNFWHSCPFDYNKDRDIVLTFDFGLFKEISSGGGSVFYLDHIMESDYTDNLNHQTCEFLSKWHLDSSGKDIFHYEGIDIGLAFREEIWNDVTSSVRIFSSLIVLKSIKYEEMFVGFKDNLVLDILDLLAIKFKKWSAKENKYKLFYFQSFRHLDTHFFSSGFKNILRSFLSAALDLIFFIIDNILPGSASKSTIYAINYYPTKEIIARFLQDKRFIIVREQYARGKDIFRQRRLPNFGLNWCYLKVSRELVADFNRRKSCQLEIDGIKISDFIFKLIIERVRLSLPECLKYIDNINAFFAKKQLKLMLTVSSLGIKNCLILDFCNKKNIPTYNVLNGLLLHTFYEEDNKDFSWINSYGESIKKNYYHNAENVVCLGDPRLDNHVNDKPKRDNHNPARRLLIGTTGFSVIDLNSYRAVEFGYFNDILSACKVLREKGAKKIDISIKLHPQCDRRQYVDFLKEYFPDFPVKLYDGILLGEALRQTDSYISSCSGTVFEASLLGVSVLYYKIDSEVLIAPYDGNSELITALSPEDLLNKIELLYNNDAIYNTFKNKSVMERYVGPLDGKNTDRNVEFIYSLIGEQR